MNYIDIKIHIKVFKIILIKSLDKRWEPIW